MNIYSFRLFQDRRRGLRGGGSPSSPHNLFMYTDTRTPIYTYLHVYINTYLPMIIIHLDYSKVGEDYGEGEVLPAERHEIYKMSRKEFLSSMWNAQSLSDCWRILKEGIYISVFIDTDIHVYVYIIYPVTLTN
jgi:hypothetical protein